jgi:hypothetical protein
MMTTLTQLPVVRAIELDAPSQPRSTRFQLLDDFLVRSECFDLGDRWTDVPATQPFFPAAQPFFVTGFDVIDRGGHVHRRSKKETSSLAPTQKPGN